MIGETLSRVPVASAALGPVAGLPAARLVASHFTVMTRETAQVLIAGPAVVERALGVSLTKEALGGPQVHLPSGVVDNLAEDEYDAVSPDPNLPVLFSAERLGTGTPARL